MIVFSYAWVPLADPALVARVHAALRPGGLVVIEHPAEGLLQPGAQPEGPSDPIDDINSLVKVWSTGFRILRYEDTEGQWDWRTEKRGCCVCSPRSGSVPKKIVSFRR